MPALLACFATLTSVALRGLRVGAAGVTSRLSGGNARAGGEKPRRISAWPAGDLMSAAMDSLSSATCSGPRRPRQGGRGCGYRAHIAAIYSSGIDEIHFVIFVIST